MNKLETLKKLITDHQFRYSELMIFVYTDTDFIATQYITEMQKIDGRTFEYVDSLTVNSLFDFNDSIKIYRCDLLDCTDTSIINGNFIIVTEGISKQSKEILGNYIFDIPKIEEWQIKDYTYSKLPNVDRTKLDELIYSCKNNLYRLDSEISKLCLFADIETPAVFDEFLYDGVFSDLSRYSVFDFTNAILKKDLDKLLVIYKEKDNIDIEPMGVVTILLNSFRDIISLQFDPRITPESSGMSKSRFWAIKYNCGIFTNKELIKIFDFLLQLDKKVKQGDISTDILVDIILLKILGG